MAQRLGDFYILLVQLHGTGKEVVFFVSLCLCVSNLFALNHGGTMAQRHGGFYILLVQLYGTGKEIVFFVPLCFVTFFYLKNEPALKILFPKFLHGSPQMQGSIHTLPDAVIPHGIGHHAE